MKLILFFSLIITSGTYAAEYTVISRSGIKLREKPDQASNAIKLIKYGDKVSTTDDLYPLSIRAQWDIKGIDGVYGYWAEVTHGSDKGYVFKGFLVSDFGKAKPSADFLSRLPSLDPQELLKELETFYACNNFRGCLWLKDKTDLKDFKNFVGRDILILAVEYFNDQIVFTADIYKEGVQIKCAVKLSSIKRIAKYNKYVATEAKCED